jgi:dipeptidyl aminopeptidase/acylaminoacyl peptidase
MNSQIKTIAQRLVIVLVASLSVCQTGRANTDVNADPAEMQHLKAVRQMGSNLVPEASRKQSVVEKHPVVIWSDGTRMSGDVYRPRDLGKDQKLPAVIFCNGTAGTKRGTAAKLAPIFVEHGFIFLAFDYRGWGESDSKFMLVDPMPPADANGEMTVRVKPLRWQMDFADQTLDIRNAISFMSGEPNVDSDRIGIMGSSYGGGLVTWVAGNDPRVKCVVAQVPGMSAGRQGAALQASYELATKQARGETEPVPVETGKLTGKMERFSQMRRNPAKSIGFNPIEAAAKIDVPMLIVMAENDELIDNKTNGMKVYDIVKSKGSVPVDYHVIKAVGHFDIYSKGFKEAVDLELQWYQDHLKDKSKLPPA